MKPATNVLMKGRIPHVLMRTRRQQNNPAIQRLGDRCQPSSSSLSSLVLKRFYSKPTPIVQFSNSNISSTNSTKNTKQQEEEQGRKNEKEYENNNGESDENREKGSSSGGDRNGGGEWKRNGTPEIIFGFTLLTILGIDQFLQSQQKKQRESVAQQLRLAVHADTIQEQQQTIHGGKAEKVEENEYLYSNHSNVTTTKKVLFQCTVRQTPKLFDGTKSLMNVHVNDVVDILEERVGPGGMYHLCGLKKKSGSNTKEEGGEEDVKKERKYASVGWFPISCLEKGNTIHKK